MDTILSRKNLVMSGLIEKAFCLSVILGVVCLQAMVMPQAIMADDVLIAHKSHASVDIKVLKKKFLLSFLRKLENKNLMSI